MDFLSIHRECAVQVFRWAQGLAGHTAGTPPHHTYLVKRKERLGCSPYFRCDSYFVPSPFGVKFLFSLVLAYGVIVTPLTTVNITSPTNINNLPSYPNPSDFPYQESLTFSTAASSFRASPSTANIPSQDSPVFTTDSPPPWLPSSSSSLPAPSPHQQPLQRQPPQGHPVRTQPQQQDFVLYETPAVRSTPSLSSQHPQNGAYRRHSSHQSSAPSLQNQRVAAIIQSTGHSISTSQLTNRFNSSAQQQQFYASSAPSSSAALQLQQQRSRPQVPLFSQSTGNIPQTPHMAFQGNKKLSLTVHVRSRDSQQSADMELFGDDAFTPFEGGASVTNAFSSAFSSPAVPTNYDFNAGNSTSQSTNMGTVSPQDLFVRDSFASAPNSAQFTNLTSPSTYNESPEYNEHFDVSPFVGDGDLDQSLAADPWYPLFPESDKLDQPTKVEQSPLIIDEELEVGDALRANRRRSGTDSSPGNHSSITGVKSRKRDQPLPPIIVDDPNDPVALKRARNTLAARKSRQRKMQRFDELEDRIAKLEVERDHWKSIALQRTGR
ncbi:hypothetical protein B0O99DRAFT_591547 [Bisporella sp. PMI_857]|nr:hypothetical protein B0O99DRAFT_591547 [Bisporella sp. PMI_857]